MARKKSHSKKKRTITPEHLAKMQAGRKAASTRRNQMAMLQESGMVLSANETKTEKMLRSLKRKS